MSWFDRFSHPRPREEALVELRRAARSARNPSSPHTAGRAAKREMDRFTETLFECLGLEPRDHDVIVTGSGAEAMRIALQGYSGRSDASVSTALRRANACARRSDERAVSVWVDEASGRRHRPNTSIIDGTCALGRVERLEQVPRILVLCGARSGGPPGIGALVRIRSAELDPLWGGGGQEHGVRSGSQAVPLVAGWCGALRAPSRSRWLAEVSNALAQALDRAGGEILMSPHERAAGVVAAAVPDELLVRLRSRGVFPAEVQVNGRSAVRFAVDASDEDDDIEALIKAIGMG